MAHTVWKLRDYLKGKGISAYQLAKALPTSRQPTIYRLASETPPTSVNLEVLGRVVAGLRELTGEAVSPNDLLEVTEETIPALRSLKPGEEGDPKLRSEPPSGSGKPRGLGKNRVTPKGGKLVSTAVREARDERKP